jgi:hypothetical protein
MLKKPWLEMIRRVATVTGWSDESCTNMVILGWLEEGKVEPLREMIEAGFRPSEDTLRYLAKMMNPNSKAPWRIETKKRGKGPGVRENQNFMRDLELTEQMLSLMKGKGLSYDAALTEVAKDKGASRSTVRNAYQRFMGQNNQLLDLNVDN